VHILKRENVFLSIEIVIVVPLSRRTGHNIQMVLPQKSVIEGEVVVPQICKRLVVALIAGSLNNGRGLPIVGRSEVVIIPEFCIKSECGLELQP